MLPGEPLWSGDASTGGPSGWAPYWAGRFELLQGVRPCVARALDIGALLCGRHRVSTGNVKPHPSSHGHPQLFRYMSGNHHVHVVSQPDLLRGIAAPGFESRVRHGHPSELISPALLIQDMQTLQRRMEFLRNEVMAAVVSGRWEPPTASDAGSSVGEL